MELRNKRTLFTKSYHFGGNKRRLLIGRKPLHFDRNGKFLDIDLTPESDGNDLAIRNAPFTLKISQDEPAYMYNSRTGQRVSVELMTAARGVRPTRAPQYRWLNVGRDTEYIIRPKPTGCVTYLILRTEHSPRNWQWKVHGDINLIPALTGQDYAGRLLELEEERTENSISVHWTGRTLNGKTLRKERNWKKEVTWPVYIDPIINEQIITDSDDAESYLYDSGSSTSTGFNTASYYIHAGIDSGGNRLRWCGVRFQTVGLDNAATITSATLDMYVNDLVGTPDLNIYGNDVNDAGAWALANRMKNITKTTAVTNKATWTNNDVNSIDVTSIVQEIVNRAGWVSGNDLAMAFFNNAPVGNHRIRFRAYPDETTTNYTNSQTYTTITEPCARLTIDYVGDDANDSPEAHLIGI